MSTGVACLISFLSGAATAIVIGLVVLVWLSTMPCFGC